MKKHNKWDLIHNPNINLSLSDTQDTINNAFANNGIYFNKFATLLQSLFEWNLPPSMNAEFLEWCLFWQGKACCIKDDINNELLNLQYTDESPPNIYNLPTKINAFSNYFHKTVSKDNFVICRNDINYTPSFLIAKYFSDKIADIETTVNMNIYAQRVSSVFSGSKEQQLSMVNAFNKFNAGTPFIFVDDDFMENIKLTNIRSETPYICDKLYELKRNYFNEFFEFIGVNTAIEKQERLLVDEVNSNNQFINLNFNTMLKQREKFCEEVNKKWGVEISVKPAINSKILKIDKGENI